MGKGKGSRLLLPPPTPRPADHPNKDGQNALIISIFIKSNNPPTLGRDLRRVLVHHLAPRVPVQPRRALALAPPLHPALHAQRRDAPVGGHAQVPRQLRVHLVRQPVQRAGRARVRPAPGCGAVVVLSRGFVGVGFFLRRTGSLGPLRGFEVGGGRDALWKGDRGDGPLFSFLFIFGDMAVAAAMTPLPLQRYHTDRSIHAPRKPPLFPEAAAATSARSSSTGL